VIDVAEQKLIHSPDDLARMDREAERKFRGAKQTTQEEGKKPDEEVPMTNSQ
jgi:hypothetical protein